MAEEEVMTPEETATEEAPPPEQEAPESPETEGSQNAEGSEEQPPEESPEEREAREKEEKKKERKKKRSKLLIRFLLLLLLAIFLLEGFLFFLLGCYSILEDEQEAQAAQTVTRRNVTNSAYAHWGGTYWPVDWPVAVDSFASIPDYPRSWPDGTDVADQPADAETGQ